MNNRTICQMEVHPLLIKLRRERMELFKRWQEIYGPNPLANSQSPFGMGLQDDTLAALFGDIGRTGVGVMRIDPYDWRREP